MKTIFWMILAIVVGVLMVLFLTIAVELFSEVVHPVPEDFDGSKEQMCTHVENYPGWVLAAVIPMWGATAFCGVWTAGKIGYPVSAVIVGLLVLIAVGFNQWMLPYPKWFEIGNFIVLPLAIFVAIQITRCSSSEVTA